MFGSTDSGGIAGRHLRAHGAFRSFERGPSAPRNLGAALGLALLAGPLGAQTAGDVAEIELRAPTMKVFTLRATVPVPQGTYPRPDGLEPFSVRNSNGTLIPAQVEHVSSFADASLGSDVVEVQARVWAPTGTQPDDRLTYQVVNAPAAPAAPNLTQPVKDLLGQSGQLVLAARDVFGNDYRIDLTEGPGSVKLLKSGRWSEQTRYYGMLRPSPSVPGSQGTLHHLMGVHSYVTAWSDEDAVSLDLRVHNGSSGLDKSLPIDDPNDDLYFESLRLLVPPGWKVLQAFDDPMFGAPYAEGSMTAYPIVAPNANGSMHVFPQQSQMERRLVVTPTSQGGRGRMILEEETLAFVRPGQNSVTGKNLYSWWNPATPHWFPQRHTLPRLGHIGAQSCRGKLAFELNKYGAHMNAGTSMNAYPLHSKRLGWAHPWGVKYGGMTSGTEIFLYDGLTTAWGASQDGYRLHQMRHRMYTDRHPTALFNKDGEPTSLHQWLIQGSNFQYVNMLFYMVVINGTEPFGFGASPVWQKNYAAANGFKPSYESELKAHQNIDLQHLIRYTHSPKVLAWMGNDALAKDDLLMQAELVRLSYHRYNTSAGGGVIVSGMLNDLNFVKKNPNVGFTYGRGPAWAADTMCAAYSMADPAWRTQARAWFDQIVDLVRAGQARCSGIIQANTGSKLLNGQYRARQSIEQAMIENSLWGMKETVYRKVSKVRVSQIETVLQMSLYSMVTGAWNASAPGPHAILAVGPLNVKAVPFCGTIPPAGVSGGADKYQTWSSFAYGYELTGDKLFLQRALEMAGGTDLRASLQGMNFNNLENISALLALTERVNYP